MQLPAKTAEILGGGPIIAVATTATTELNATLETVTLCLGILTGLLSAYFLIRRFVQERRMKKAVQKQIDDLAQRKK